MKILPKNYTCKCGKIYETNSGLWKHVKTCKGNIEIIYEDKQYSIIKENPDIVDVLINENKEFKNVIIELLKNNSDLQKQMMEVCQKIQPTTNNNINNTNNINSHNKNFNLNFFLNEQCKDALNINEFVNSLVLGVKDLEQTAKLGYVEGISNIILKNLNALDITLRPIHCTDKKRETMYIKDEGEWSKEDEKNTKLTKAVTKVADKNIKLLPQFREKYPEYKNSSSKTSDKYDKMVLEVMTCDDDKNEKIVKNISKVTIIKE